jgi:vacuolar-type H+-ATPase subunit I/STV1
VSELDHALFSLKHCIDFLSRWDKRGFGEKLFGEKPQISRKKKEEILNFDYKTILEEIKQLEEKEKELDSQIRFLQKELEFLIPLEDLDLPIRDVRATDSTKILIGFLPFSQFEEFQQRSKEESIWCKIIHKAKRQAYITVIYHVSHEDLVLQILREVNFHKY